MLFKWIIVFVLVYFIYKKYIALPSGEKDNEKLDLKDKNNSANAEKADTNEDYIDFEEVD